MSKKEERFVETYSQEWGTTRILVDKQTGVNYLCTSMGQGGGICVLVDKEGKPIITTVYDEDF